MTGIQLNFINNSNDTNNSQIVIFQKNTASNFEEIVVAWRVIENCGKGWSHPFNYPIQSYVSVSDSWGNTSPQKPAADGQCFNVINDQSGDILKPSGQSTGTNEISILNALQTGAINANIYKEGKLLATQMGLAPTQKAAFAFEPTIWIGAVSQFEEGAVMNSAILSQVNTEISLLGIKSADIVMTGGGPGSGATPFVFTLQNVVYA